MVVCIIYFTDIDSNLFYKIMPTLALACQYGHLISSQHHPVESRSWVASPPYPVSFMHSSAPDFLLTDFTAKLVQLTQPRQLHSGYNMLPSVLLMVPRQGRYRPWPCDLIAPEPVRFKRTYQAHRVLQLPTIEATRPGVFERPRL